MLGNVILMLERRIERRYGLFGTVLGFLWLIEGPIFRRVFEVNLAWAPRPELEFGWRVKEHQKRIGSVEFLESIINLARMEWSSL